MSLSAVVIVFVMSVSLLISPFAAQTSAPDAAVGPCNDRWRPGLPVNGVDGYVYAIAMAGDGSVYVGGSFTVAGNTVANNIAKWDGTNWSALGTGPNGGVGAIA